MHRSASLFNCPYPPTLGPQRWVLMAVSVLDITPSNTTITSQCPWPFPRSHLPPTSSTDTETPKKDTETPKKQHSWPIHVIIKGQKGSFDPCPAASQKHSISSVL